MIAKPIQILQKTKPKPISAYAANNSDDGKPKEPDPVENQQTQS